MPDLEADELMKLLRAGKATAEDQTYAANWIAEKDARIGTLGNKLAAANGYAAGADIDCAEWKARALAAEARLADKEADCVRLVHEKMDMFEAKIAAEARAAELEAANERLARLGRAVEREWDEALASLVREDGQ